VREKGGGLRRQHVGQSSIEGRRRRDSVADDLPAGAIWLAFLGYILVLLWFPLLFGYEPLIAALVLFVAASGFSVRWARAHRGIPGRSSRIVVALVVGVGLTISSSSTTALLASPRWTGAGDWATCAELAAVKPDAAVRIVAAARGLDMLEIHAGVAPRLLNETGWEFDVSCIGGLTTSSLGGSVPSIDGQAHFVWLVSIIHDYELLGFPTWIDWNTGACVANCP